VKQQQQQQHDDDDDSKIIPIQAWRGLRASGVGGSQNFWTVAHERGKVVSPRHRPL